MTNINIFAYIFVFVYFGSVKFKPNTTYASKKRSSKLSIINCLIVFKPDDGFDGSKIVQNKKYIIILIFVKLELSFILKKNN